jgi:hypothetical protein
LDEIAKFLIENWRPITVSPLPFALSSVFFFGLGYWLVKLIYKKKVQENSARLTTVRDELARLEKVLTDERNDYNYHRAETDALRADIERLSAIIAGEDLHENENDKGAIHKQIAGKPQLCPLLSTNLFLRQPEDNIDEAIKKARLMKKLVFMIIYDPDHPTKSNLAYALGHFLQYQTTRKLVDQSFVCCMVPVSNETAKALIPAEDDLENCRWIVLNVKGDILCSESLHANPDEGLARIRKVIELVEPSLDS